MQTISRISLNEESRYILLYEENKNIFTFKNIYEARARKISIITIRPY